MKPVFQDIIDAEKGNCMSACLASVFEIGLEDVPNFWEMARGSTPRMQDAMVEWLRTVGYGLLTVPVKTFTPFSQLLGCYALAGVKSQMFEVNHGIVITWVQKAEYTVGIEVVHDPNSKNKRKYEPSEIIDLSFLIPIKPRIL